MLRSVSTADVCAALAMAGMSEEAYLFARAKFTGDDVAEKELVNLTKQRFITGGYGDHASGMAILALNGVLWTKVCPRCLGSGNEYTSEGAEPCGKCFTLGYIDLTATEEARIMKMSRYKWVNNKSAHNAIQEANEGLRKLEFEALTKLVKQIG